MTRKERLLVAALASGAAIEDAAEAAGYNLAYARQKAGEAAILAAVESAKAAPPRRRRKKLDIGQELKDIILDPACDQAIKLTAMRVFIAWLRYEPPAKVEPPIIIDDIGGMDAADPIRLPEGPQGVPEDSEADREPEQEEGRGGGGAEGLYAVGGV